MKYLHTLLLTAASQSGSLSLVADFSVACGISQAGEPVLGSCSDLDYLVAGGIPGMPYSNDLGPAGGHVDFTFPVPVTALVVATYAGFMPAANVVSVPYLPPPPPADLPLIVGSYELTDSFHDGVTTSAVIVIMQPNDRLYSVLFRFDSRMDNAAALALAASVIPIGSEWKGEGNYPGYNIS